MTRLRHNPALMLVLATALLAAGCDRNGQERKLSLKQTGLPGHVTAGGGSSGEVLSRSQQANKSTAPAGTPGIPQGSEGNTSGAALGGTTAGSTQQPAQTEKQKLADSMDAVAARWRTGAQASGLQLAAPTRVKAIQGFDASISQSGASGQPGGQLGAEAARAPVRSEKSGTAEPSRDVKDDSKRRSPGGVKSMAPDKAGF